MPPDATQRFHSETANPWAKWGGFSILVPFRPRGAKYEVILMSMGARLAQEHGTQTILKPAALSSLPCELAVLTDYLILDQEEARSLAPEADTLADCAAALLKKGVGTVLITGKETGCDLFCGAERTHFPAIRNFTITDRTGSSDAFISALASFLNENYALEQAIRLALYASAFCSALQGVYPALVDRETLLAYVEKHEPELLVQSAKGG